jgi:hypothetical protein
VTAQLVKPDDVRPARPDGTCFYCHEALGSEHKWECVAATRPVVVRATIEYVIDVPRSWTAENIDFHRNDSSWCSGNLIDELERLDEHDGCLCNTTKFEYLRDYNGPDKPWRENAAQPTYRGEGSRNAERARRAWDLLHGPRSQVRCELQHSAASLRAASMETR